MLKRNGEDCEHPVPNYPGLLTASEYQAYQLAVPLVAEAVHQFNERADTLADLEKQATRIVGQVAASSTHGLPSTTVRETPESVWQIRHTLFKSPRSEMLLCSRDAGGKQPFGVVERFDPQSPYARIHGDSALQMTGSDAAVLLHKFADSERAVLQLFRQDIEATVEAMLAEKFPGQNLSRVVRAISARCGNQMPVEGANERPARSVKIRL